MNENGNYSEKLSAAQIEALDFKIVWLGNSPTTKYESNDKKAVLALTKILEDFSTIVKKPEFQGFPLASTVSHLRAFLYEQILAEQAAFYTSIVMSGEPRGTGKR